MNEVKIDTEFIKLQQAMKLSNIVSQGSDAKLMILNEEVKVNGELCLERGKKLRDGDIFEVEGYGEYKIIGV